MAESSLSAKSASPRELKRSYRAEERTWAGTASSIAALVDVPDPCGHLLREGAGRAGPGVEVPARGGPADGFSPGRAGNVAGAGSQPREDRIEVLAPPPLPADHQAIPALPSPAPAA